MDPLPRSVDDSSLYVGIAIAMAKRRNPSLSLSFCYYRFPSWNDCYVLKSGKMNIIYVTPFELLHRQLLFLFVYERARAGLCTIEWNTTLAHINIKNIVYTSTRPSAFARTHTNFLWSIKRNRLRNSHRRYFNPLAK